MSVPMAKKPAEQTPEQRIKALEKQLAASQLKATFFERVVHLMKEDYAIELKKSQLDSLKKKT